MPSLTGLTRAEFKSRINELVTISQTTPRPSWWPVSGQYGWPIPYALEDTWWVIDVAQRSWDMVIGPGIISSINFAWETLKSWFSSLSGSADDADDIADKIEEWCAANNETAWEV